MSIGLRYRFTNSSQILTELSHDLQSHPPHLPPAAVEEVDSLKYIDNGLSLLGHLHQARDTQICRELTEFDRKLASFNKNLSKISERLEGFRKEVGQRFEEVGQRFEEMDARMFNSLSYRRHHVVRPIALFERGRGRQSPDPKCFPKTVKLFWQLQSNQKARHRLYLLQFYHIEGYKYWEPPAAEDDSDSSNSERETLTLEQAVHAYPLRCLEALAACLGLSYDKIAEEMQREREETPPAQPVKRGQGDITPDQESGQPSKKPFVKRRSMQSQRSNLSEAEQGQDSHGSTDIAPESVDLAHRPREQNPTVKTPTRSRRSKPEAQSQVSTDTMSSTELKRIAQGFL